MKSPHKMHEIITEYCNATEMTHEQLTIKSRKREIIEKRVILINLLRKNRCKFEAIGEALNLDHTTILYHTKSFDMIIKFDKDLRNKWESFQYLIQA